MGILGRLRELYEYGQRCGQGRLAYRIAIGVTSKLRLKRWIWFSVGDIFCTKVSELGTIARVPRVFTIGAANPEDAPKLGALLGYLERVEQRFREGDRCYLLRCDGEIRAVEWAAVGPKQYWEDVKDYNCVLGIPPGACWLFDGHGRAPGAWGTLMKSMPGQLQQLGVHTVYNHVDFNNPLSYSSHRSLGFVPAGKLLRVKLAGLSFTVYRGTSPGWRFLPGRIRDLELWRPEDVEHPRSG
jgi:hypothetical protein